MKKTDNEPGPLDDKVTGGVPTSRTSLFAIVLRVFFLGIPVLILLGWGLFLAITPGGVDAGDLTPIGPIYDARSGDWTLFNTVQNSHYINEGCNYGK